MTESVKANGTTLDLSTEKGRANQSAFNGLAQAAMTTVEAHAKETLAAKGSAAAQAELQSGLKGSYKDLVAAAGQLGITGDEADTMARKALGIPKNVNIDAWIADHASTTLDGIKGKADQLDGKTVNLYTNIHETTFLNTVRSDSVAPTRGGADKRTAAYATGGRAYGPGTSTSDSVDARLSKDEYVLTAAAARKVGYANLDKLNGGDTQPLKAGVQYAPASAPARQMSMASAPDVNVSAPAVAVYIGNEQLDARMFKVASATVSAADSQSQFSRRGR